MRIGLDILSEIAGQSSGTETYLLGFLKALEQVSEEQHQFFLFVNTGNEDFYRNIGPNFIQVHFPFSNYNRPLRVLSQLTLIPFHVRRLKLDVVNFHGTTGAFGIRCPTVQHIKTLHRHAVERGRAIFRQLIVGPSARAADIIIANSQNTRQAIVKHLNISPQRIVVIPEAVDHSIFRPKGPGDANHRILSKYKIEKHYLLFVSSLWPYKNVHGLIEAYAILLQRYRICHDLVIIGGIGGCDYKEQLQRLLISHALKERVHFLGHIRDRYEIRCFYVNADIYIHPSYEETFGLTLLESMACGTPVVASNRTSIPEIAGDAAIIVDPDDYEEIAEAIWMIISNSTLRASLIKKGLARAQEFTWERTTRETLQAYQLVAR